MNWQDCYAIAKSLREDVDWLFAQGRHQYASEGVWGAMHYASRALKARYGGLSLEKGYIPGQYNSQDAVDARIALWRSARRLHRHFYNSNLTAVQLAVNRNDATVLLDEAFGALDA